MKKFLLIGLGLLIIVAGVALVIRALQFRLVAATPNNQSTAITPPSEITFVFSKPINESELPSIQINPPVPGKLSVSGKIVTYSVSEPVKYSQKYIISLADIVSTKNKKITKLELTFTTASQSPEDAAKQKSLQSLLPYTTNQFSVDYLQTDGSYSITILSDPLESSKQAALDFLAIYNITLEKNKITFYSIPGLSGSGSVGP